MTDIPIGHDRNADQIAYWNGPGGQRWTDRQQAQDIMLAPVSDILIDRAKACTGERIVDIGCGCGATSIALARKVGPTGHVFGIDISGPMLDRARQLAPPDMPIDFVLADATVYQFVSGKFRSPGLAIRRNVFCGARAFLCQYAPGAAAIGPADIRLLARATRKPVVDGAAAGRLQTCPEAAAARTGRSRPVLVRIRTRVHGILSAAGFSGIAMEPCNLSLDIIGRARSRCGRRNRPRNRAGEPRA